MLRLAVLVSGGGTNLQAILDAMGEALSLTCSGKKLLVTLGQFSIIRLERDTQLLIPVQDR